jgi:hypothetical protein
VGPGCQFAGNIWLRIETQAEEEWQQAMDHQKEYEGATAVLSHGSLM